MTDESQPEKATGAIFLVLTIGRSGSGWLAEALAAAAANKSGYCVQHEPQDMFANDRWAMPLARYRADQAERYVRNVRGPYIRGKLEEHGAYIEVNPLLRYHGKALKEYFERLTVVQLVRDGRDVVRSLMTLNHHYTGAFVNQDLYIHPLPGEPWREEWDRLTRFEKCAWFWQDAQRQMWDVSDRIVRFEDLLTDYDSFSEFLAGMGLSLPETRYKWAVENKVNARPHTFPHWAEWTDDEMQSFDTIAGEVNRELGYAGPGSD